MNDRLLTWHYWTARPNARELARMIATPSVTLGPRPDLAARPIPEPRSIWTGRIIHRGPYDWPLAGLHNSESA